MADHHHHDIQSDLTFEEKLLKLLNHWIKHNDDHAGTYQEWMERMKEHHMDEAANLIEEAATLTHRINETFEAVIRLLKK